MIGILGGMGTQAGLDFCNKLAILYRGKIDQEYPLFILYNKSNIPGRPESIGVQTKNLFNKEKGFTAADAKLLGELSNAVEISFQHPDTDDSWITPIKNLGKLKRLHLEKTKITDKALDTVGAISSLEYLNLYQTAVTDGGMDKLKNLKKNFMTKYL
mgnify:CR=1 FL=1